MALLFPVGTAVRRAEIPALCADLADRLRGRPGGIVICDVGGTEPPGVATVEALARLRLTARRHGWRLHLRDAGPEVWQLLDLLGLTRAMTPEERPATGPPGDRPA
ncbi:STAS domain-containing protein [Actinoplanes sp. DH11]|uniref:STAS domain-containing protein n=1 Tax=Actinoplanes sp. DH11 TaxID=2857011 RepID=UPI001E416112|nr:STAS domain-containing protein [Actinoplanes sp. DH11]